MTGFITAFSGDAGSYHDVIGVTTDALGNIYSISSISANIITWQNYVFVTKYDSTGIILWHVAITGFGDATTNPNANEVVIDSTGSYLYVSITGAPNSTIAAQQWYQNGCGIVVKLSTIDGSIVWQKYVSSTNDTYGFNLLVDSADNIILSGLIYQYPTNPKNLPFLAKITSSGSLSWYRDYSGSTYGDTFRRIAKTSSGDIIAAGGESGTGNEFLMKISATNGDIIWKSGINITSGNNGILAVCVDQNDNIYAAAEAAWIAKYNSSGTIQWQKQINAGGSGYGYYWPTLTVTAAGESILATPSDFGISIVRFDTNGNVIFKNTVLNTTGATIPDQYSITLINNETDVLLGGMIPIVFGDEEKKSASLIKLKADGTDIGTYPWISYSTLTDTISTSSMSVISPTSSVASNVFSPSLLTSQLQSVKMHTLDYKEIY